MGPRWLTHEVKHCHFCGNIERAFQLEERDHNVAVSVMEPWPLANIALDLNRVTAYITKRVVLVSVYVLV